MAIEDSAHKSTSNNIILTKNPRVIVQGNKNIIHPMVSFSIVGTNPSTTLVIKGNENIFEERCSIIFTSNNNEVVIGSRNHFQISSTVSVSDSIGNGNIFMPLSVFAAESYKIGDDTKVGTKVKVVVKAPLADSPSASIQNRTFWADNMNSPSKPFDGDLHSKHVEYLLETLPKYH